MKNLCCQKSTVVHTRGMEAISVSFLQLSPELQSFTSPLEDPSKQQTKWKLKIVHIHRNIVAWAEMHTPIVSHNYPLLELMIFVLAEVSKGDTWDCKSQYYLGDMGPEILVFDFTGDAQSTTVRYSRILLLQFLRDRVRRMQQPEEHNTWENVENSMNLLMRWLTLTRHEC